MTMPINNTIATPPDLNKAHILDKLGRPMTDLRISLTDRCNFNCNYCLPDKDVVFLPRAELLTFEESERFVKVAVTLGIEKIKLTGGEPTLRMGMDKFVEKLTNIPQIKDIGLITNGYFLKSIGHRLRKAGLKRISISLDALDERIFQVIVGNTHSVHPVLEGIQTAVDLGFDPIKINCVIQRGLNEDQIIPLVDYFRKPHFHLRFIEFMDVGDIAWERQKVVPSRETLDIIQAHYPLSKQTPTYYGEVASRYKYDDGNGEIGFISSVSNPFCQDCTRLRLSADGVLYGCLFTDKGLNIKHLLRKSDDDDLLLNTLSQFWQERDDRYSELRAEMPSSRKHMNMNYMGG